MASGQGTIVFDFGSTPGSSIAVTTGVTATGLSTASKLEIYIDGTVSTATHNTLEHQLLGLFGLTMYPTTKSTNSFDAQACTTLRLTGTISANFVWSD